MKPSAKKGIQGNVRDCAEVVTRTTPLFSFISEILSILIFSAGIAVLLGWVLDISILKSVFPDLVTMKANTALCFTLSGFSLWALQVKRRDQPPFQRMARLCSLVVFGIGLGTFGEYLFGKNLGIDQFLFKELPGALLTSSPGRMAFNTAINFTIIGLALFLLATKTKIGHFLSQILMLLVVFVSILAFVGYVYHASPLVFGLHFSTAMALHTMILFLILFFGILYCRPGCGIMTLVSSEAIGGKLIRRIFPFAVLLPLILGWLKLEGEKAGVVTNEFGSAFVAVGNLSLMALYVYMLSFWVNRADFARIKSETVVRASEEKYRGLFENSSDAIMILKPPLWRFVSGNQTTIEMFQAKNEDEFTSFEPWRLSPERQPDGRASVEKAKEMINAAVREGRHFFEWTHKRISGEEFLATVVLTRIGQGQEMVLLATVRDITREKQAAEELKKKIEELERFNRIAVGRELKMIELKEKIKALEEGKR